MNRTDLLLAWIACREHAAAMDDTAVWHRRRYDAIAAAFGANLEHPPSGDEEDPWTRQVVSVIRDKTAERGQQPLWEPDEGDLKDLVGRFNDLVDEVLRLRLPR